MSYKKWETKITCTEYVEAVINIDILNLRIKYLLDNLEWYDRIYLSNELNCILLKYENEIENQ